MRSFQILFCVSAVSAFNFFPDIFQRNKRQEVCQVYTVVQYPCAVETWVASNTVLWVDACSTALNVTNAPTSLTTTLTSTTTLGVTSTSTTIVTVSLQTTSTVSTTLTLPGPAQSSSTSQTPPANPVSPTTSVDSTSLIINPTSPGASVPSLTLATTADVLTGITPILSLASSSVPLSTSDPSLPDIPSSTALLPTSTLATSSPAPPTSTLAESSPSPTCSPPSTTGYAPGNNIPANTTYLLQLYWSPSPGSLAPYGGNVYLKRDGSYTAANSVNGAVNAFFADVTLIAADPVFIYGWYTTTSYPVDTPFALGEYLPEAGLVARSFTMAPTSPPTLMWENCGFEGGAAEFVLDQDNGLVYVVFDGNENQGTSHIPIYLVPTIYL